ncbi:ImmA/IrrE family metallo-endopeptidase [Acinetobacter baumannii]|uniref:ImmA/IrrE family metallo-endopeptidase n=1 Tax=Acinetobacter calcoaceticus/baumannii complex TaxID=909768 RepID=UPI000DD057D6|nr:ImmA/IrrE family metallo-endopeptidase [Acinetobacter baumannii]MDC4852129.1 ImmA/IrrE family metallo-endopeptidase [Acinetobacter baumannii]MDC4956656.1 ImmA/IrrE family metallo-endopeptidase [Acinetobacter baumannii]MDH2567995.1 ImmA/IrrE family metallo-endopeptidase [Acinetobacter baumannii]MDN8225295.1 ImmA/IrrE family metallo-endopeptidase [Acinetobacter baumannii]MDV4221245.1 ImmA/IrrE family metallo-endopeptidase [Acinetobacter baumannii]
MEMFKSPEKLLASLSIKHPDLMCAPINLEKICSLYKISLEEEFLLDSIIGKILLDNGKVKIIINSSENGSEQRKRFTIAHELGHFFLHLNDQQSSFIDDVKTMSRTQSYWTPVEAQANDFAARLLMPLELIIREAEELVKTNDIEEEDFVKQLAKIFQVSKQAMTYRLKNIGII